MTLDYSDSDIYVPHDPADYASYITELTDAIFVAWDHLTDIPPLSRSALVSQAIDALEDYLPVDDDEFEEDDAHETVTMNIPEHLRQYLPESGIHNAYMDDDFNVEIDTWLSPVIEELWNQNLMTYFSCQGHPDFEEKTKRPNGYISGPMTTNPRKVMMILEQFGIEANVLEHDTSPPMVEEQWAVRFPSLNGMVSKL